MKIFKKKEEKCLKMFKIEEVRETLKVEEIALQIIYRITIMGAVAEFSGLKESLIRKKKELGQRRMCFVCRKEEGGPLVLKAGFFEKKCIFSY